MTDEQAMMAAGTTDAVRAESEYDRARDSALEEAAQICEALHATPPQDVDTNTARRLAETAHGAVLALSGAARRIRALKSNRESTTALDAERRAHRRTLDALAAARMQHAESLAASEAAFHDAVQTMRAQMGAHLELRRRVRAVFDTHTIREWGAFDCNMIHEAMAESMATLEDAYRESIGVLSDADRRKRERWIFRKGIGVATGDLIGADDEQCDREIAKCPVGRGRS